MSIANLTATKDGDTLEQNADVSESDLAALLDYADEIVIHEVHDEEWVEDRKARYAEEWDEKVEMGEPTDDEDEDEQEFDDSALELTGDTCWAKDCESDATMAAHCQQGAVHHCCDEHAGGRRSGTLLVEEWVQIQGDA